MFHDWRVDYFFTVILLISALVFFGTIIYFLHEPSIVGYTIIAQGGNVTRVDIQATSYTINDWFIISGFITNLGVHNYTGYSSGTVELNLTASNPDAYPIWIFAGESDRLDLESLVAIHPSIVDDYLDVSASYSLSATNTFRDLKNVTIQNVTYEAWVATTNSVQGDYITAIFQSNDDIFFAASAVENGTGFNGKPLNYQLIYPLNDTGGASLNFIVLDNASLLDCDTIDLKISLSQDHAEIELEWDEVNNSMQYEIFYIDDVSNPPYGYDFNFSNASFYSVTDSSWTDPEPRSSITSRFYSVHAVAGPKRCTVPHIVGIANVPLTINQSSLNLITTPFNLTNDTLVEVIAPIVNDLKSVYWYNNTKPGGYRPFIVRNISGTLYFLDHIKNMRPYEGYWFEVSRNTTLPLYGHVLNKTILEPTQTLNLIGFHYMKGNNTARAIYEPHYPELMSSYWYNNDLKRYEAFIVRWVGAWYALGSYTIDPFKGFFISVRNDTIIEVT